MSLQDYINGINGYFKEMNIIENIVYVSVAFPKKWIIDKTIEDNFNVKITANTKLDNANEIGYYYFAQFDNNIIDNIFNAIKYTINFNLQAEEKIKLLLSKIEELKEIFNEEDINTLKTLQFKYKKKKTKILKDKNDITDTTETAPNSQLSIGDANNASSYYIDGDNDEIENNVFDNKM